MNTTTFKTSSQGHCPISKTPPDQKTIHRVLASAKRKRLSANTIIIARYGFLKRQKLPLPEKMLLPNLCLTIKNGKLVRAFFSNVMTHIIKKQNYYIQILN
jgi:hypothetical protein